jgi:glutamate dehydrogenase
MRDATFSLEAARLASGVPEALAQTVSRWPVLHTSLDVIELATRTGHEPHEVARVYWQIFETLDLRWLWDAIGSLPRSDRWQAQARSALRDDLLATLADLTDDVLCAGSVASWLAQAGPTVTHTTAMFREIRRADTAGITALSVALRQLRNLSLMVTRG